MQRLFASWRGLAWPYRIGGAGAAFIVIAVGVHVATRAPATPEAAPSATAHVSTATVGSLSTTVAPLSVTGQVTSRARATVLAQTSGTVVALYHALGDRVAAGAIIAAFGNSSQRAAVAQAQGALDAARAVAAASSGSTAANTRAGVSAALTSAVAALDDAVTVRADALFTNPRTDTPALVLTVPDSALVSTLVSERRAMQATLADAARAAGPLTDPDAAADAVTADLDAALGFLGNLLTAVNETPASQAASAATLAGYQASLAAARSELTAALSGVTSAKSAYDANNQPVAQANVAQAQAGLEAAEAALEKTLVRSPISGTIISLPVTEGDVVTAFSPVAVVSNPGALYADVEVTSADARTLAVGGKAAVGGVPGVITSIAPALDPATGKIEVKVGLTGSTRALTDGEVVAVSLDRAAPAAAAGAQLRIPLNAAKITPQGPIVFTVTASSTLAAHPVALGAILGDQVVVSGITATTTIVTDARGLAAGQTVVVDAPR
jgi:RND family efflux transporter MFP subunit